MLEDNAPGRAANLKYTSIIMAFTIAFSLANLLIFRLEGVLLAVYFAILITAVITIQFHLNQSLENGKVSSKFHKFLAVLITFSVSVAGTILVEWIARTIGGD